MIYRTDRGLVAAIIPGDREAVETKLQSELGLKEIELLPPEEFDSLGIPFGYAGPVGLKEILPEIIMVIDKRITDFKNAVVGANEQDYHLINVTYGRDFVADAVGDIVEAKDGDICPICSQTLREEKAIEVGHIFQLGTKYSEALEAYFLDEKGNRIPFYMGSYGIGVSRILAAAVEQNNDERGMFLPYPIAPFEVHLLLLNPSDEELKKAAEEIYRMLSVEGYEVLYDDRTEVTPGSKFADADLIGIPLQLIVGKKFKEEGKVEIKERRTNSRKLLDAAAVKPYLEDWKKSEQNKYTPVYDE